MARQEPSTGRGGVADWLVGARILASLLWIIVLIVPPFRWALIQIVRVLWPNTGIFVQLSEVHPVWAPVVICVLIGYVVTVTVLHLVVLPRIGGTEIPKGLMRRGGLGLLELIAIVATVGWAVVLFFYGALGVPEVMVVVLVIAGLSSGTLPKPAPTPRPGPSPPLPPAEFEEDSEDETTYYRVYHWFFNEEPYRREGRQHQFKVALPIPKAVYNDYSGRAHEVRSEADYVRFINEELDDEVVTPLAQRLRAIVENKAFDELAEIHLLMAFTLSFSYQYDSEQFGQGEYPLYPVELLVRRRGDCEDHANLCGALLHNLGHRVALVLMDIDSNGGHAALAVESPVSIPGFCFTDRETGAEMFYCEVTPAINATTGETTDVQWWLGMGASEKATRFRLWKVAGR